MLMTSGLTSQRRLIRDLLGVCIIAIVIAITPNVTGSIIAGDSSAISSIDDLYYLLVARAPYYGESELHNPYRPAGDTAPSFYQPLNFSPFARVASLLGIPLAHLTIVWRVFGAACTAAALYWLFRLLLFEQGQSLPLLCTVVCLSDPGFTSGRFFVDMWRMVPNVLHHTTPYRVGDFIGQYRVVTPLVNIWPLFVLAGCLIPKPVRTWRTYLLAIAAFGLLMHLYFFFWVAAAMALAVYLGVLLAFPRSVERYLTVKPHQERVFVAAVLALGLIIGASTILGHFHALHSADITEQLERGHRAMKVPWGNRWRYAYVLSFWPLAALGAGGVAIVRLRIAKLWPLWLLILVSYLLRNHHLISGIDVENYHWGYVQSAFGEILVLCLVAEAWSHWGPRLTGSYRSILRKFAFASVAILPCIAIGWRCYETVVAPEDIQYRREISELADIRPVLSAIDGHTVVAGEPIIEVAGLYNPAGILSTATSTMLALPIQLLHERHALNGWLTGMSREEYAATCGESYGAPFKPPLWTVEQTRAARLALFDEIVGGAGKALVERERVTSLLLHTSAPTPVRGGSWTRVGTGSRWSLWSRAAN
jgi:hypothetical protein